MSNTSKHELNTAHAYDKAVNVFNSSEKTGSDVPIGPALLRVRHTVTKAVHRILKDRYSDGRVPNGMYENMANFAIQLESTLYKEASTFEEYKDLSTLKVRIKQIAKSVLSSRPSSERKEQIPLPHQPSHSNLGSDKERLIDYNASAVRQQIQRILLLRHAARCPHERGKCPHISHCGALKDLWCHVSSCSDRNCQFRHCVSSRYILAHYSKCDSTECPVCVPVRGVIKSASGERKRSMSAADLYDDENKVQRTENQAYATTAVKEVAENAQPQFLEQGIREKLVMILEELCRKPYADIFSTPVDQQGLNLVDYNDIISEPMDLGTILSRLHQERFYRGVEDVVLDVHLTFDNAMAYNPVGTDVYTLAKSYRDAFDFLYQQQIWSLVSNGELEKCDLSKAMYKS